MSVQFQTMEELQTICDQTGKKISEVMLEREVEQQNQSREDIIEQMKERLTYMQQAIQQSIDDQKEAPSGISGGDAWLLTNYKQGNHYASGSYIMDAMRYAAATSETNAKMGVIVATPTAGSCGILPGCLFSLNDNEDLSLDNLATGLFAASALGYIIANQSFVSGAAGGCQAEVGSATAMAAGAIVELRGGTPEQSVQATAMALKSLLGLVCDPVAGLVEVPCIKRNIIGTAIAFS